MSKTVAIYGATAFSAGPAIEYLVNHPDASQFELILAGRNRDKLANVHSKLCKGKEVETIALELSDEKGVKDLVDKADVVMNFAGMRDISLDREVAELQVLTASTMLRLSSGKPAG